MIKIVTNALNTKSATPTTRKVLGKDDFLRLLVAQLRYQDPTDPMKNNEFISQTAQFSSLEQMQNMNDNVRSLIELQRLSNSTKSLELIGKKVSVKSTNFELSPGESIEFSYSLPERADVTVSIVDSRQQVVKTFTFKGQGPGAHKVVWDGTDRIGNKLEKGMYSFMVSAKNEQGEDVVIESSISGTVDAVELEDGEPRIRIGNFLARLSDVRSIWSDVA